MFKRCTEPARRSIFFALARTRFCDRPEITPVDLLAGLIWEENSRAQTLFNLRDYFPLYQGCPWKCTPDLKALGGPPLDGDSKLCLGWTTLEADHLGDYWIDTEHLLLGIARTRDCEAAQYLAMIGLTPDIIRQAVQDNKLSRPAFGPVPLWWRIKSRVGRLSLRGQTP